MLSVILLTTLFSLFGHMPVLAASLHDDSYILVGGQIGAWFQNEQRPRLYRIQLYNQTETQLTPITSKGTVWAGHWNGSRWLISGWGADSGAGNSNPYLFLYDGQNQVEAGSRNQYEAEASWHGGDVFSVSYNGTHWLLSGLGSDSLGKGQEPVNHMGLGLFDDHNFIDLSTRIPDQWDAILFANAWNGHYWLMGGGWEGNQGVLIRYDGTNFTDLSPELESAMPQFDSVQSVQWNGDYWLIGGVGFLAKYDGEKFTDLTPQLNAALDTRHALRISSCCNAVNALEWNGVSWLIGGGAPVSVTQPLTAWAATYDGAKFIDLTSLIPTDIRTATLGSSILTIAHTSDSWFLGGYANGNGTLLSYVNSKIADLSNLIGGKMSTVNWIGGWPQTPPESSHTSTLQAYAPVYIILAVTVALTIKYGRRIREHFGIRATALPQHGDAKAKRVAHFT